jgi:hypothetical protein
MIAQGTYRRAQRAIVRLAQRDEQAARQIVGVLAATDWRVTCLLPGEDTPDELEEASAAPVELPSVVSRPLAKNRAKRPTKAEREALVVELRKLPYKEYLKSEHWLRRRKIAYAKAKGACQVCNAKDKKLNVHHRTYERLGNEAPSDVIVLCEDCHKIFHVNKKLAT